MKQATLVRRAQNWEKQKYLLDKGTDALKVLANPVTMLVGGFALTTVLEHTKIGVTDNDTKEVKVNWWPTLLGPLGLLLFPDAGKVTDIPAGSPVYVLSEDQANVCRGALVALAAGQSGLLNLAGSLMK